MTDVHICTGTNKQYIARVRRPRARRFHCFPPRRTSLSALRKMVEAWDGGHYQEADVIMTSDWYEPVIIARLKGR